jgi:hypothetical protein
MSITAELALPPSGAPSTEESLRKRTGAELWGRLRDDTHSKASRHAYVVNRQFVDKMAARRSSFERIKRFDRMARCCCPHSGLMKLVESLICTLLITVLIVFLSCIITISNLDSIQALPPELGYFGVGGIAAMVLQGFCIGCVYKIDESLSKIEEEVSEENRRHERTRLSDGVVAV